MGGGVATTSKRMGRKMVQKMKNEKGKRMKKVETEWVNAVEVGEILRMSASMVRVHMRAGKFKSARLYHGTRWTVDKAEIVAISLGKIEVDFSGSWGAVYGKAD